MKKILIRIISAFFITGSVFAQGFDVKASGSQTFSFKDDKGRNQATFYSATPLEDINGITSDINGTVTFNVDDFANTLKGEIIISASSIKTGIDMRDGHLKSDGWLNAEKFPNISFNIKSVKNVEKVESNKIKADIVGDFTLHGTTKEKTAKATITYLDESEKTKMRAPGDLLGVTAAFDVKLSEYGVENKLIGEKVAENVEVKITMVGSNAK